VIDEEEFKREEEKLKLELKRKRELIELTYKVDEV